MDAIDVFPTFVQTPPAFMTPAEPSWTEKRDIAAIAHKMNCILLAPQNMTPPPKSQLTEQMGKSGARGGVLFHHSRQSVDSLVRIGKPRLRAALGLRTRSPISD